MVPLVLTVLHGLAKASLVPGPKGLQFHALSPDGSGFRNSVLSSLKKPRHAALGRDPRGGHSPMLHDALLVGTASPYRRCRASRRIGEVTHLAGEDRIDALAEQQHGAGWQGA
jgi:hypothetical protein